MIDYRPISVDHAGQVWSARYCMRDGFVEVDSAYGSRRATAVRDPAKRKAQAQGMLMDIVRARKA